MTMRKDLDSFHDIIRQCSREESSASGSASPDAATVSPVAAPVNLHVTRYNSLARGFYRARPEVELWVALKDEVAHPLTRYSLINRARPPAIKSVVWPEVGAGGLVWCPSRDGPKRDRGRHSESVSLARRAVGGGRLGGRVDLSDWEEISTVGGDAATNP